jgi:hypothetical protein
VHPGAGQGPYKTRELASSAFLPAPGRTWGYMWSANVCCMGFPLSSKVNTLVGLCTRCGRLGVGAAFTALSGTCFTGVLGVAATVDCAEFGLGEIVGVMPRIRGPVEGRGGQGGVEYIATGCRGVLEDGHVLEEGLTGFSRIDAFGAATFAYKGALMRDP